jgi:hypothetical protein
MHEMTKWEWVLNNPEWVNVLTTSLFAAFTIGIIATQAILSNHAQQRQNMLLQYQLEYARMRSLNIVREEVLALVSKLRRCLSLVKLGSGEGLGWDDMREAVYDLIDKVNSLDASIYSGYYDGWCGTLRGYMDDVFEAVKNDSDVDGGTGPCPTAATLAAFDEAESKWSPLDIAVEIKTAIRMSGNVFYEKWSGLLPVD